MWRKLRTTLPTTREKAKERAPFTPVDSVKPPVGIDTELFVSLAPAGNATPDQKPPQKGEDGRGGIAPSQTEASEQQTADGAGNAFGLADIGLLFLSW